MNPVTTLTLPYFCKIQLNNILTSVYKLSDFGIKNLSHFFYMFYPFYPSCLLREE